MPGHGQMNALVGNNPGHFALFQVIIRQRIPGHTIENDATSTLVKILLNRYPVTQ